MEGGQAKLSPERLAELTRRLHYLHQNHLQHSAFLSDIGAFPSRQQKKQFWHRFWDLLLAPVRQYNFNVILGESLVYEVNRI